jgi:hypothetical protein
MRRLAFPGSGRRGDPVMTLKGATFLSNEKKF